MDKMKVELSGSVYDFDKVIQGEGVNRVIHFVDTIGGRARYVRSEFWLNRASAKASAATRAEAERLIAEARESGK